MRFQLVVKEGHLTQPPALLVLDASRFHEDAPAIVHGRAERLARTQADTHSRLAL